MQLTSLTVRAEVDAGAGLILVLAPVWRGDVMVDGVSRARAVRPLDLSRPLGATGAPAAGILEELAADGHR